jgi:hypothetical protein
LVLAGGSKIPSFERNRLKVLLGVHFACNLSKEKGRPFEARPGLAAGKYASVMLTSPEILEAAGGGYFLSQCLRLQYEEGWGSLMWQEHKGREPVDGSREKIGTQ